MKISIIEASKQNISILLSMNKQLMEDEKFDRPLTDDKLIERWNSFFTEKKYKILLFQSNKSIIGYAVIHMDQDPLYLRHFFIKREFRRKGYGRESFKIMIDNLGITKMDLDVMSWNERGYNFWKSLGFTERCKLMTFNK